MQETIVALATPPLRSALSIVRLSGDDCFDIVEKFFSKKIKIEKNNGILHGFILENSEIIDEVVVLVYKEPYSFTGENSIEIISHGTPLVFNKIIELALKYGAKLAERGEYSSRSYLHGKIDLIQAESINDLINAESEASKKLSILSLKGETTTLISPLKKDFGDLMSNLEVNIDYPEYQDIEVANYEKIRFIANKNLNYINKLIKNGYKGKIIKDGINVAIVGKPNVGKSSILNALLNEEKAIVSSIKGTTRDVVEGKVVLNNLLINFFDTAGIRESTDEIEEIGIIKSKKQILNADLVLMVLDSNELSFEDKEILSLLKGKKYLIVYNKEDLLNKKDKDKLYISALNKNIEPLKKAIIDQFELSKDNFDSPSINNTRELGILESVKLDLEDLLTSVKEIKPIDLIANDVRNIYLKILSLTGEDFDFDITKEIFSRFCVGK